MSGEKRFDPTARKLRQARMAGDTAKSRDLTAAVGLVTGFTGCFVLYGSVAVGIENLFGCLEGARDINDKTVVLFLVTGWKVLVWNLLAYFCWMFFGVFLIEVAQVGIVFSLKPLAFQLSRLNPTQGLKRMLGIDAGQQNASLLPYVVEVGRLAFHFGIVAAAGWFAWRAFMGPLQQSWWQDPSEVFAVVKEAALKLFSPVLTAALAFGIAGLIYARHKRRKRLGMDSEEFKREIRESEGDPELKAVRKLVHQELSERGLAEGVRRARIIVMSEGR